MDDDSFEEEAFRLLATRYSERFGSVSKLYRRQVTEAYGRDLVRAMGDPDDQVRQTVAAWNQTRDLLGHGPE